MGYWKELGLGAGRAWLESLQGREDWASRRAALNLSFLSFWVLIRPESQLLPEADVKLEKVRTGTSWEAYILEVKQMTDL